jgi:hypothetical protein
VSPRREGEGRGLTRSTDIVPPRREEGVVSPGDLLRQDIDTLVVERRKSTQERVEHASQSPQVDRLAVHVVLDNLRRRVPDRAARRHRLLVPDDLGQSKVGNLDTSDSSAADPRDELSLVLLVFVVGSVLGVFRGDNGDGVEEDVLRLDITREGQSESVWEREGEPCGEAHRWTTPRSSCR